MIFRDRQAAGLALAERLSTHAGQNAVVFALPRGGVVLAREVARKLGAPLDIIAVRKLGHPQQPEYAVGAVDEHGDVLLGAQAEGLAPEEIERIVGRERAEAERRAALYRNKRAPRSAAGKVAVIVDDGIATGLTMQLAVASIRKQKPERIIIAVPVAPAEAVAELERSGASIFVLDDPKEYLGAVGAHYAVFPQVTDDEVIALLS